MSPAFPQTGKKGPWRLIGQKYSLMKQEKVLLKKRKTSERRLKKEKGKEGQEEANAVNRRRAKNTQKRADASQRKKVRMQKRANAGKCLPLSPKRGKRVPGDKLVQNIV